MATGKAAGISDAAVKAKTGKIWREWFTILDKAKASQMEHRGIAMLLREKHRLPAWWSQMITVGYEQAKGLRQTHQTKAGYRVSASRTLPVPIGDLYLAWSTPKARARWLKQPWIVVPTATPNKSMRITWTGGKTSLNVCFWDKGAGKSQVRIEHGKLGSQDEVAAKRAYWAEALDRLKAALSLK